jgi:hypothetical protein
LPEQLRALALRAYLLFAKGEVGDALAAAAESASKMAETKATHLYCVDHYAWVAEIRLVAWAAGGAKRGGVAERDAKASCRTLGEAARIFPTAVPIHCLHEGTRRWLLGAQRDAIRLWERGLAEARRVDVPLDAARLELTLGRRAPSHAGLRAAAEAKLSSLGVREVEAMRIP